MTNSERRVSLMQQCVPPPGDARPDWEIACRFAALLGYEPQFSYTSAGDIFEEHKSCCSDVYQLQMNGISYRRLKRHAVQWPCPDYSSHGVARRYRRKVFATANGKARFHPVDYLPPSESLTAEYPLTLVTGRLANHWHSRTKTSHVAKLDNQNVAPFVSVNPADAAELKLVDGDAVCLMSSRGSALTTAKMDDSVTAGTVFMPFHWGQSFREDGCVNALTTGAADPISRQPELKYCAVRLEKAV